MAIAKGTPVRQVVTPIEGTVEGYEVDQETGQLQYNVAWTDADGNVQNTFFKDGDIVAI